MPASTARRLLRLLAVLLLPLALGACHGFHVVGLWHGHGHGHGHHHHGHHHHHHHHCR
jgi:hypothetical protein